jgi:predicted Fe-Mo cluster-binding NifX family protein
MPQSGSPAELSSIAYGYPFAISTIGRRLPPRTAALARNVQFSLRGNTMKLAITSVDEGIESSVDLRFGRAKYFVVVDLETHATTTVSNSVNLNAAQGAGIQTAKTLIDLGVKAVITGHVGPKAFVALEAGGVAIYPVAGGTVAQTLEQFQAGSLKTIAGADVEGHW